jgi:hypothetical protein
MHSAQVAASRVSQAASPNDKMGMQAALKKLQYACFKDTASGLSARPSTITCLLFAATMQRNVDTLLKHVASQSHKNAFRKSEKQAVGNSVVCVGTRLSHAMVLSLSHFFALHRSCGTLLTPFEVFMPFKSDEDSGRCFSS